jgi:hypothetical protein
VQKASAAGIQVVAVTPDAAPILHAFATAHHLAYPLLSDLGGKVIQAFGLLNPNIPLNPRQAAGQPFPGHFLIAPDGAVLAKAFTGDLRHRVSGSALVLEYAGDTDEPGIILQNEVLSAHVTLSATRLFGGQEIAVVVDVDIADGWHVYADSVPTPYTPLAIDIDTEGDLLALQRFTMPTPMQIEFVSTGETLPVYERRVRVFGRARLRWSPPPSMFAGLEEAVSRRAIAPGEYRLHGVLRYQACNDIVCLEPRVERFELPIVVEANIAPTSLL